MATSKKSKSIRIAKKSCNSVIKQKDSIVGKIEVYQHRNEPFVDVNVRYEQFSQKTQQAAESFNDRSRSQKRNKTCPVLYFILTVGLKQDCLEYRGRMNTFLRKIERIKTYLTIISIPCSALNAINELRVRIIPIHHSPI